MPWPKWRSNQRWWSRPQGARVSVIQPAATSRRGRGAGQAVEVEAVDEAAADVGLGELPADQRGDIAHMAVDRLVDPDLGPDQRVVQQVAADLVGLVGEVVRRQQQPRRADAVGGDDHDLGRLELGAAGLAVDVDARRWRARPGPSRSAAPGRGCAARCRPPAPWARSTANTCSSTRAGSRCRCRSRCSRAGRHSPREITPASAGHQCQPRWSKAWDRRRAALVKGSGPVGQESRGGIAGSPARPLTPIMRSAAS